MQFLLVSLLAAGLSATPTKDFEKLWDYSAPEKSESFFWDHLEESGEREPSYRLEVLTQIARAQGLQGKFEAARTLLEKIASAPDGQQTKLVRVRLLLEKGRVLNSSGKPLDSLPIFQQAYDLALESGLDRYAADAAHMLGIASPTKESKVRWSLEGVRVASSSSDPDTRKWLGPLYNNLGWTYHDAQDFEPALTSFCHALEEYTVQGKAESIRIARWSVARCLRSLGRLDEAIAYQESLWYELQKAGEEDGFVHEELAELYLKHDGLRKARPHASQAYQLLRQKSWVEEKRLEREQTSLRSNRSERAGCA